MIDVEHKWRTRIEIEAALDAGNVWVAMSNGNYWQARRNGKTQTWKREPNKFRIPIKFGFKNYGEIDQDNMQSHELVISPTKPAPWKVTIK